MWVGPEYKDYALKRLTEKAAKHAKFPPEQRGVPFMVALDARMPPHISPSKFRALLYGSNCDYGTPRLHPAGKHEDRIAEARACGWGPLFERVGFNAYGRVRVDDTGRYFDEFQGWRGCWCGRRIVCSGSPTRSRTGLRATRR